MSWYKYPTKMKNQMAEKAALDITSTDDQDMNVIHINPDKEYQEFLGMGTSLEEATINNLIQLSPEVQDEFLRKLVDPKQGGMTLFRITVGTSDFTSKKFYTYYDAKELNEKNAIKNGDGSFSPDWQNVTGNGFSIQKDEDYKIIATIKKVQAFAKEYGVEDEVKFFASSWTPPGWMKNETSSSKSYADNDLLLKGGSLKDDAIEDLAVYYTRYLEEYAKQGIDIYAMTLQNEPMLEINYPSCAMSGVQEGKLAIAIKKAINNSSILTKEQKKCKLWAFDHNPSGAYSYAEKILSVYGANDALDGVAFHDYGGSLTEMQRVLDNLLNKNGRTDQTVNLTERSVWGTAGANSIITYFRNSGISYNSWVTMLDSNVGVHQWVGTPDPTMFARAAGSDNDYWAMPEFYITGQFSRFIRPGYVRVDSDEGIANVGNVVFKNPETRELTAVVSNNTDKKQNFKFEINGIQIICAIPAKNVATYVWKQPDKIQNDVGKGFAASDFAEASEGVSIAEDGSISAASEEDYADYIVNIKKAGTYGICFAQQSDEAGKAISIWQGDNKLREVNTVAGDRLTVVRGVLTFEKAGIQQIRIKMSKGIALSAITLDEMDAYHAIPGKIAADAYRDLSGVAAVTQEHTLRDMAAGTKITYAVEVPEDDTYQVQMDAEAQESISGKVTVDDGKAQTFDKTAFELSLTAGKHQITVEPDQISVLKSIAFGSYIDVDAPVILENSEDGKKVTFTVTGGTIAEATADTEIAEVTGLPEVVQAAVTRVSDTKAELVLNGNRTRDFDSDLTVTVLLSVRQNSGKTYAVKAQFVITAVDDEERVSVAEDADLSVPSAIGGEKTITLKMQGGTFRADGADQITVSGDAAEYYDVKAITWKDSSTVDVTVSYKKKFYRPAQLVFEIPTAAYDAGTVSLKAAAGMEPEQGLPWIIWLQWKNQEPICLQQIMPYRMQHRYHCGQTVSWKKVQLQWEVWYFRQPEAGQTIRRVTVLP